MVMVRTVHQETINRILRPNKVRFGAAKVTDPFGVMEKAGRTKLRVYRTQRPVEYERYYDFKSKRVLINYKVPTRGKTVRLTDLEGNVMIAGRKLLRHGRFRIKYARDNFHEQKIHAYLLLDECFDLMKKHKAKSEGRYNLPITIPSLEIRCRFREDFQAGNFSRFADVWMILLSNCFMKQF